MTSRHTNSHFPSDLLCIYYQADIKAQAMPDISEKISAYQSVLDFCAKSKECLKNQTVKTQQILYWTYLHIGDLFIQKNLDVFEQTNLMHALQAYQNALEFADDNQEQLNVLTKIRDIYHRFDNHNMAVKTSVQMANLVDDALKIDMFLRLADQSVSKEEEVYFLEQALKFVTEEKISTLKQCEHTLEICARLLKIYEKAGQKADMARIYSIQNQAHRIMPTQYI